MDFASVGIKAASVGYELRLLLKRVYINSIVREEGEETTTTKTKEKRKRIKKFTFSSRQTFKSEQEPFLHILYGKNDYNYDKFSQSQKRVLACFMCYFHCSCHFRQYLTDILVY